MVKYTFIRIKIELFFFFENSRKIVHNEGNNIWKRIDGWNGRKHGMPASIYKINDLVSFSIITGHDIYEISIMKKADNHRLIIYENRTDIPSIIHFLSCGHILK